MSTTTKKTKKKATNKGLAGVAKKKEEIFYDPETGKRISRAGYMMRMLSGTGKILDMKAVLK